MSLPLSERIAARLLLKDGSSKGRLKADFLAHKLDIAAAMADGWSIRSIWETLNAEGKIQVTYQAFCNQVHRWIDNKKHHLAPVDVTDASTPNPKKSTVRTPPVQHKKLEPDAVDGFKFSATPNSEDLF